MVPRGPSGTVTCGNGLRWMPCLLMACKRSGVRIPIDPQVRAINRNLSRRLSALYSSKVQQRPHISDRTPVRIRSPCGVSRWPALRCMRLSSRVASRNAMALLNVASRGPRNGCYGGTRQLAELNVYLPPVQQVSRSAHGAAGSELRGSAGTPGGAERPGAGTGARSPGARARVTSGRIGERKQARSGAPLRAWRSPAHAGARGHPRRASSVRCGRSDTR